MAKHCLDGEDLVSECLRVNVKDEDEEAQSVANDLHWSSLPFIKQENYEEVSRRWETEPDAHIIKETPDCPSGVRRKCKRKRRRKWEEEDWPSAVEQSEGSGTDSLWRCRLCQHCFSSCWELTGHCCTGIMGSESDKVAAAPEGSRSKGVEFCCPVCGDRFLRPTAFIMHKRSHVGQSHYACSVCGRTLRSLRKLAAHRRQHTRAAACHHTCRECGRSPCECASDAAHEEGQTHESVHSDDGGKETNNLNSSEDAITHCAQLAAQVLQSPQCLQCFMTFRDMETAERHLRFNHPAEYEQQIRGHTVFACRVCDQTFPSSRMLLDHQRTHSKWSLTTAGPEDSSQDCAPDSSVILSDRHKAKECHKYGRISMSCIYCHIIFTDRRTWERHMTAKHPAGLPPQAAAGTRPISCSSPPQPPGVSRHPNAV